MSDIPVSFNNLTNRKGNTMMKDFKWIFENNPQVNNLDAVVGYIHASGYFSLRPFLRAQGQTGQTLCETKMSKESSKKAKLNHNCRV